MIITVNQFEFQTNGLFHNTETITTMKIRCNHHGILNLNGDNLGLLKILRFRMKNI